jgi:hypothetical protein
VVAGIPLLVVARARVHVRRPAALRERQLAAVSGAGGSEGNAGLISELKRLPLRFRLLLRLRLVHLLGGLRHNFWEVII